MLPARRQYRHRTEFLNPFTCKRTEDKALPSAPDRSVRRCLLLAATCAASYVLHYRSRVPGDAPGRSPRGRAGWRRLKSRATDRQTAVCHGRGEVRFRKRITTGKRLLSTQIVGKITGRCWDFRKLPVSFTLPVTKPAPSSLSNLTKWNLTGQPAKFRRNPPACDLLVHRFFQDRANITVS